jgi:hypothetical protein
MEPPRLPLHDRPNGFLNGANIQIAAGKGAKATKAGKRIVPAEYMDAFKQQISGSDMTKIALIEHLKKQYEVPHCIPAHPILTNTSPGSQNSKRTRSLTLFRLLQHVLEPNKPTNDGFYTPMAPSPECTIPWSSKVFV